MLIKDDIGISVFRDIWALNALQQHTEVKLQILNIMLDDTTVMY